MKQEAFDPRLVNVTVPELGAGADSIRLVTWLVPVKARVIPGERIAELLTQGAVFQLEAPAEGTLWAQLAAPGEAVHAGQSIATIRRDE